ncbi:Outer membrane protein TolC [Chryseobacterium sp. RU37D]|uniref:TolC family protein n=1 Tax=Chryseobacterium sp. RU37D TaxID=1907397 RepID=UPI000953C1E3|nr:TolC family protein [Chryseobacterium sp. RU37D]SIQ98968.1 Outer membrane protein TolC [Chryseobacterium sp. RU37D]
MNKKYFVIFIALCTSCAGLKKEKVQKDIEDLKKNSEVLTHLEIPEQWIMDRNLSAEEFDTSWIKEIYYDDLGAFIKEGLEHNATKLLVQEKLNQIEIAMDIAASNLYPSVNAIAGSSSNLVSGTQIQKVGVQANWELDLWGKNKANKLASTSAYFSAKYKFERLQQTLVGMIAKSYYLNVAGEAQENKIKLYLTLAENLKQLYLVRKNVGTANDLDISNIQSEIITIKSDLEKIQNANQQSKRALELLVGKYPEGKLTPKGNLSSLKTKIPTHLPLQLLENRPDILAQHFLIEKSFYEVKEAKASRLPSLSISSIFGAANTNLNAINSLFSNPLLNVGGSIVSPLFNGSKLKKNVEIKNSQQKEAVEEYAKTVLESLNEIESSLANLNSLVKQLAYDIEVVQEFDKNIELTKKQISIGNNNNFDLIQKQRMKLKKEISIIDINLQNRIERINLFLALGCPKYDLVK